MDSLYENYRNWLWLRRVDPWRKFRRIGVNREKVVVQIPFVLIMSKAVLSTAEGVCKHKAIH